MRQLRRGEGDGEPINQRITGNLMLWDASVGAAVSVLNRIPRSLCPVYLVGLSPMPPHARVLIQLSSVRGSVRLMAGCVAWDVPAVEEAAEE